MMNCVIRSEEEELEMEEKSDAGIKKEEENLNNKQGNYRRMTTKDIAARLRDENPTIYGCWKCDLCVQGDSWW